MMSRHSHTTRLIHAGLAATVIAQLASSLIMDPDHGGLLFEVHEYSGLTACALVLAFWVHGLIRRRGTPLALLVPWLSARHSRPVLNDIKLHLTALRQSRMPPYGDKAPLASRLFTGWGCCR